jgi:hypothetical protein
VDFTLEDPFSSDTKFEEIGAIKLRILDFWTGSNHIELA